MALRDGPEPVLRKLKDAADECRYAAVLIESWLLGGIEIEGRRQEIEARDIAILYPRLPGREEAMRALQAKLRGGGTPAVILSGPDAKGGLAENAVRIMAMHGSRGLQFRVVVLLWADLLSRRKDDDASRGLLYVAMTRAEDLLVVLHSGDSPYLDELQAAIEHARH